MHVDHERPLARFKSRAVGRRRSFVGDLRGAWLKGGKSESVSRSSRMSRRVMVTVTIEQTASDSL